MYDKHCALYIIVIHCYSMKYVFISNLGLYIVFNRLMEQVLLPRCKLLHSNDAMAEMHTEGGAPWNVPLTPEIFGHLIKKLSLQTSLLNH